MRDAKRNEMVLLYGGNGADAADDGFVGADTIGGRGIDVEVEVEAHVTEMLNGAGAADDGCEGGLCSRR